MATKNNTAISRDGLLDSPCQSGLAPVKSNESADNAMLYDVVIIGGGITGMTAALMLQNAGKKCLLIEAETIGFGTTGGTSVHINTFSDTTYPEARSAFGKEGAQLFADAVNEGYAIIKENIKTYRIACDFALKKGYVYAVTNDQVKQLEYLCQGMHDVGLDCEYADDIPSPVAHRVTVVLQNQVEAY